VNDDEDDALWVYVGQISGVLTVCGAVIVIIVAIVLTLVRPEDHFTSTEDTWISFLSGVGAAGIISLVYGALLFKDKLGAFKDEGKLAVIAFWFGLGIIIVALAGLIIPAVIGTTP
jgi:hypothetical protein